MESVKFVAALAFEGRVEGMLLDIFEPVKIVSSPIVILQTVPVSNPQPDFRCSEQLLSLR